MTLRKLNYGCGRDYLEGFVNVDHSSAVKTDLCCDLSDVWFAYGDNAFDFVLLKHVFEHIQDQMAFMEQLYRLCAPGATVEIHCPYWSSADAWADPDHKHAISEKTFFHFDRSAYLWEPNNPITSAHRDQFLPACDFTATRVVCIMADPFKNVTPEEQQYARQHLLNAVAEIRITLQVIKPAREK